MYRRNHLAKVIAFAVSGHPNNGSTDQPAICGRSILALRLQAVRRPHGSSDFALQSGLRPADTPRLGRRGGFIETALPGWPTPVREGADGTVLCKRKLAERRLWRRRVFAPS